MAPISKRRKLSNGDAVASPPTSEIAEPSNASSQKLKNDAKDHRRSLFVRSLPASITTERLTEYFSQSYPLKHATVVLDKITGTSRGFGFVTFTDAEDAQNAVTEFNGSVLDGRKIKVEIAESRNRELAEDLATGRSRGSVNIKGQELRAERQKQQQDNRPPKLIIRNLPWSIKTSDDLARLFLSYGKVKHAVVPKLPQKVKGGAQPQAGFGIVILRGKKNAENALQGVNGKEVDGRVLAVDWAVDKDTWEKVKDDQEENIEEQEPDTTADKQPNEMGTTGQDLSDETSSDGSASENEDEDDVEMANLDDDLPNLSEHDGTETEDDDNGNSAEGGINLDGSALPSISEDKTKDQNNTTVFIRNVPFTADDNSLYVHFKSNFGPVRYARVVYDLDTERPRGTAFVSFYSEDIARECVKNAPRHESAYTTNDKNDRTQKRESVTHSLLQNEMSDPSGKYTMEGRVLQVTRALPKLEADHRANESSKKRSENKRRLYLLSEGTIPKGSSLYKLLGKAEMDIRESSSRQRQKLVKENPNLGLSLSRLSIRNIPRNLSSKELKALAREAIVGFAKDVKDGKRQPLNKEELSRGGEEDRDAERIRKEKGKGIVKQVKIVFESEKTGGKVREGKGGRSRGYGFIEYYGHRHALMGLRWLNGHLVKINAGDGGERNKRLIVEFAIENAQVVQRRADREKRAKEVAPDGQAVAEGSRKRKHTEDDKSEPATRAKGEKDGKQTKPSRKNKTEEVNQDEQNKVAARNRIIAQKRQKRKARKGRP